MAPAQPSAVAAIERSVKARLSSTASSAQHTRPAETVARIFDALPGDAGENLLAALYDKEPNAGERVRALMFNFADLASLTPAGLQTLLSRANRATLTLALKGVTGEVADAFYKNMTARARDVLQEEIAALGPRPRTAVEDARTELVTLTRTLIDAGEIRPRGSDTDEDLIL
jgi:flagellar motor switch protein FliG